METLSSSPGVVSPVQGTPMNFGKRLKAVFQVHPALCVYGCALLVRLAVLALFSTSPHFGVQSGDMRFYHDWALRILGGQWTDGHAFYGLPGYAYLLAFVYGIFGVHPGAMLVLQAGVDAATAALVFQMARAVIPADPRRAWQATAAALLASLGWMFYIPAQTFSAVLMPTVLSATCYWFCVYRALTWRELPSLGKWLGLGTLVGGVAMMVATVLFALPLLVVSALRTAAPGARKALAVLVLLAGLFLGSSPAWLHNRFLAHEPVFLSAHGGINFWIGNAPGANGYPKIPEGLRAGQQELLYDSIALAEKASGHALTRAAVSQYWSQKARAHIRHDPGAWARLMARKLKNFWNAFSYDDVTIIPLLREEEVLLPGLSFGLVATLGLLGMGCSMAGILRRTDRLGANPTTPSPLWVVAAVLLHMAALLPVFITERYRLAAVPGLLVLGALGLAQMLSYALARRWGAVTGCLLTLSLAAIFVHLPAPSEMLTIMEPYNLAISELEVGQVDRAEKHLLQVTALNPGNPSVLFAQGNLWMKRGKPDQAKGYYRQTLEKEPRHADALTNLGVIAYGEQRWELACRFFQAALAIQPQDAETQRWLAMAQAKMPLLLSPTP